MIDGDPHATDAAVRLTYPRVYASPDGETHFQDVAVPMAPAVFVPGIPLVDVAAPDPVTALTFARVEAGYTSDWHPPPRRQFVLIVAGGLELTVTDGEVRQFGPGDIFLVEDTAGQGSSDARGGDGRLRLRHRRLRLTVNCAVAIVDAVAIPETSTVRKWDASLACDLTPEWSWRGEERGLPRANAARCGVSLPTRMRFWHAQHQQGCAQTRQYRVGTQCWV